MKARVKVRTRAYPVASRGGVIESNHARQSSRSAHVPRVSMVRIDEVCFIRFESRVGCFHASSRRRRACTSSREIQSIHLFRIQPFTRTSSTSSTSSSRYVCTRSSVGWVIFISSTPVVGRRSSPSPPPTPWTRTNRVGASSSPVFFHASTTPPTAVGRFRPFV